MKGSLVSWPAGILVCLLLTAAALLPAGCTASGARSGDEASKSTPPNPLDVQVKLDGTRTSRAIISTDGGKVSATAADGTKFTLTLPKGALISDDEITLTPVSAIEGLPFTGAIAGAVQMAPEGLRLLKPAILHIESPKTTAAKGFETVAFGYHESGKGLYLAPSEAKDGAVTIEVWHFSGGGAGQATSAEIQTQQTQHVPSNAEDAFTQDLREYIGRQKQAELLPGQEPDPEFQDRMENSMSEAYDKFVGPELPIALKDCGKAPAIMSKAMGWARQVQLMARSRDLQAKAAGVIDTYEKVKEKCWKGYKAVGTWQEGTFSGTVSSLEKPFTLTVTGPGAETKLAFTPSGREAGTFTIRGHGDAGAIFTGSGTYTVQDPDSTSPTLVTKDKGGTAVSGLHMSWSNNIPIKLVPLN